MEEENYKIRNLELQLRLLSKHPSEKDIDNILDKFEPKEIAEYISNGSSFRYKSFVIDYLEMHRTKKIEVQNSLLEIAYKKNKLRAEYRR